MENPQSKGTLLVCGSEIAEQIDLPINSSEKNRLSFLQETVGGHIEIIPLEADRYLVISANEKLDIHFENELATDIAHACHSICEISIQLTRASHGC